MRHGASGATQLTTIWIIFILLGQKEPNDRSHEKIIDCSLFKIEQQQVAYT